MKFVSVMADSLQAASNLLHVGGLWVVVNHVEDIV